MNNSVRLVFFVFVLVLAFAQQGCGAKKMDAKTLPGAATLRKLLPQGFSAAAVLPENRENVSHKIVNQYGNTLHVIPEGNMFDKAVRDSLRSLFPAAHKLSDDSRQNVIVFVDGALAINTFLGNYFTTIRLMLLTTDGEEIGRIEVKSKEHSGLINDATAVYNAYLKAVNSAIQQILKRHPSYIQRMASLPMKKLPRRISQGTGFFVNEQGDILTNNHVVERCGDVVAIIEGQMYRAAPVAFDKEHDLAVIRVSFLSKQYPAFDGAQSSMGQAIYVFGYGHQNLTQSQVELFPSVTTGVVSYLGDPKNIHITAPIQPGNSGSPVINAGGHIVGIVSSTADALSYASRTGALPQNVNIAVRSNVILSFLKKNRISFVTRQNVEDSGMRATSENQESDSPSGEQHLKPSSEEIARVFNDRVVAVRCKAP